MSQRVKTSARELVSPLSSSPENGHLRKNKVLLPHVIGVLATFVVHVLLRLRFSSLMGGFLAKSGSPV